MRSLRSSQPLAELLKKSRELRIRLSMNSDFAAKLQKSIEEAKKRAPGRSLFSPE